MFRGVDVIVSSENTYLEMSKVFGDTLSAAVRRAGARLGESGEVLDDTVSRELARWQQEHARSGLAVAPGTVAPTGPGELRRSGTRRIYHAAVAVPEANGRAYRVTPEAVARAVHNVFRLASRERWRFAPPLRSIAFPLFGAGRGGVPPGESFSWLWSSILREARFGESGPGAWELHVITRSTASASAVLERLGRRPD
jgi:O-acetyl-ADP-ribose deacetylase (regulator of RNase III)